MNLEKERLLYQPPTPVALQNLSLLQMEEKEQMEETLGELFPKTRHQKVVSFIKGEEKHFQPVRVGVLFSGGQAAGGHNVVISLLDALQEMNPHSQLFGFLHGPKGLILGNHTLLTKEILAPFRNQGGFDLLGSGRDKIETPEQFQATKQVIQKLQLDAVVIIGGDDSNTLAANLAEHLEGVSIIGVPKTIDGDLQNRYVDISFGFDTACKTYAETIGNIARDAKSAGKYYFFVKLMGRTSSHVALECALKTHPNLTLLGEEIASKKASLASVVGEITDLVVDRAKVGKEFGVILIPEGIIEFIPDIKLPEHILKDLDPHGNIQVSKIESERLLLEMVKEELKKRNDYKGKFSAQPLFLGYEGRSSFPSNFDATYCTALGRVAALLVAHKKTGMMAAVSSLADPACVWQGFGVPLMPLMQMEERKGKRIPVVGKSFVDLGGEPFKTFEKARNGWRMEDNYQMPGPIQFFGPAALTDSIPLTVQLKNER